ncbi:MAG: hypothetical protein AAF626_10600 [Pseudomonadota bacterium]
MSAWIKLATAVAEKNGVADDLFVRDRMSNKDKDGDGTIDAINDDRLDNRAIEEKQFKNGDMAVKFGGKGVAGNAVAKFGKGDDDDSTMNSAETAADEFAALINTIKQSGAANVILGNDKLDWNSLATAFGATSSKELVNPDNSNFDQDRDLIVVKQNSMVVDEDFRVNLKGAGIGGGGGAFALFEEEDEADAFIFAAQEAVSTELLGVKDSGQSGTWNQVAADNNAISSRDTFTFNKDGIELGDDPEIEFTTKTIEEFGFTVSIGGLGIGGNANAKFDTEAGALAFEAIIETLLDLGLEDHVF